MTDAASGEKVGALRRRAIKSIFRDEWSLLDPAENQVGTLSETGWLKAAASRLINLLPQSYVIKNTADATEATLNQHFNPFVLKYTLHIKKRAPDIDRRLLIAAGILLAAIERRQQ